MHLRQSKNALTLSERAFTEETDQVLDESSCLTSACRPFKEPHAHVENRKTLQRSLLRPSSR